METHEVGKKIQVTILDDHQSIVDGYLYRLEKDPQIQVAATLAYGEELEPSLVAYATDVLLLDVNVPTSAENHNPYPIMHVIPKLLQLYTDLNILVISMHAERGLIRAVMEAGASGYILKDDQATVKDLGSVVRSIAAGGVHFSQLAMDLYTKHLSAENNDLLSLRQLEALSLCAAYPDSSSSELAQKMNVGNSTVRNLLSAAYLKLGVHSRAAAIATARDLGMIAPHQIEIPK
jgi:two-component system nitrate/nitrite response regulator NarL